MENKKKIYILGGVFLIIAIIMAIFIINQNKIEEEKVFPSEQEAFTLKGSIDPNDTRTIGYEYIDANTLHFWNEKDDYYLNLTSGIQFSNHYEEYWTHNIFCAGYKTTQWNYQCVDDLPIQLNVYSDNSTYVQVNGTRVIQIAERNIGIGIDYYLGIEDNELEITIGMKHLSGDPITNDLAFAWRVNDIQIGGDVENDKIKVNNSVYDLSDDLDLLFTNMTKEETRYNQTWNGNCDELCLNETYLEENPDFYYDYCTGDCYDTTNYTVLVPIPIYKLYDNAFVQLRWNPNLTYFLQVKNTSQYNAPVTLAIVTTGLDVGQQKQTTFFWKDPTPVVILNLPADESTGLSTPLSFTANITDINDLTNFSLWHNISGTWALNQTKYPELPDNQLDDLFNNINMTGSVLLFHLNNDSNYGENDSLAYDFSGNNNNGSVTTVSHVDGGKFGGGFDFDYTSGTDKILANGSGSLNISGQEITMSVWIKAGADVSDIIIGKPHASTHTSPYLKYGFFIATNRQVEMRIDTTVITATGVPCGNGVWCHVVGTKNSSHMTIFIDGVAINTVAKTTAIQTSIQDLIIGQNVDGGEVFDGVIDEVLIMNRSLSPVEVQRLYNVTKDYKVNYTIDNIADGTYSWNVQAWDNESTSDWNDINWTFSVGAVGEDSCSPNSPLTSNYIYNCSDDCDITSNLNAGGYNVTINGTGTFTLNANITNFDEIFLLGQDSSNKCVATCINGCFKD